MDELSQNHSRRVILLFVKYPEPGRVKTRIAATAGEKKAVKIYRELVARVCKGLPRDVDVIVYFDPPEKRAEVIKWLLPMLPRAAGWEPQAAGDLGERLRRAFAWTFATGWREVAVIGSDCVTVTPEIFAEAFASLADCDASIGPTVDGGYYLLALRAPKPRLFEKIRWSTQHTLADTLKRGRRLRFCVLPKLADVDTEADWEACVRRKNERGWGGGGLLSQSGC